jgi:hypothetical protein
MAALSQLDKFEMRTLYDNIWLLLNEAELKPIPERAAPADPHVQFRRAFEYFQRRSSPKFINLGNLNDADRDNLVRAGISPRYLFANLKKTIRGAYFDALAFQSTAIIDQAVYAYCPFTGNLLKSEHSLLANINTIFYRFNSQQVFYIITGGLNGFKKNALYFPTLELIVSTGSSWTFEEEDLFELKARVVANSSSCYRYLSNIVGVRKKVAVCIGFFHFAHHFWNELAGIDRLCKQQDLLNSVEKVYVLREPLGAIDQIFPEILKDKIKRVENIDIMFREIVEHNYFVIRIGNHYAARDLPHRVHRVAIANCAHETLGKVAAVREKYSPLLWVGIRIGSRTWLNQAVGLSELINSLHTKFPRLGVVFDGFSLPADRSAASTNNHEYGYIVDKENQIVTDVVERLQHDTPGIFNIIGSSIFEANVWAHAIDVYISPYGTLQHKVGWFANKPGIIHTNQTVLTNPAKYIWTAVDGAVRPRYVNREAVTDVRKPQGAIIYRKLSDLDESGAGIRAGIQRVQEDREFDNYELDSQMVLKEIHSVIRSPRLIPSVDLQVLENGSRKRVKKILQRLTTLLDHAKI